MKTWLPYVIKKLVNICCFEVQSHAFVLGGGEGTEIEEHSG